MSAFLGRIHYWLYNKIQLHEKLIAEVAALAKSKGYESGVDAIVQDSYRKYGFPVTGVLEDEIVHSNIHGWLQERISSVEQRLAYVITEVLKSNLLKKDEITELFKQNAAGIVRESGINQGSPQDFFNLVFDYMLEGMPCDRVNEIIESNDNSITWKTTICLHKDYWDEAGGDINDFYDFRSAWINALLRESKSGYEYMRTNDAVSTIKRM